MTNKIFAVLLTAALILSLGACATEEGEHTAALGPGAIFKMTGVSGQAMIENHGPGKIQVSCLKADDEVVSESLIEGGFEGEIPVEREETLKVENVDEEDWARLSLHFERHEADHDH